MKLFTKRSFCAALAASLLAPAWALDVTKPVTLMVPYPAGGVSDAIARIFAGPFGKALGGQALVDNLGGVSGSLAAGKVLAAPADGHMLFQGSPNELILASLASKAVKLKPEDFRMVLPISNAVMVVYTRKDLPAKNVDELIELARKSSTPLTYGTVGVGSLYHILTERVGQLTKTTLTHVPYKGAAPVIQDLIGGRVDFAILPHGGTAHGLVKDGKLAMIATLEPKRLDILPDTPTVAESRVLKGFTYTIWTGYAVPKATPEADVQKLHKALQETIAQPRVRGELQGQFQIVAPAMSLAEAQKYYEAQTKVYRDLAAQINLQPQ